MNHFYSFKFSAEILHVVVYLPELLLISVILDFISDHSNIWISSERISFVFIFSHGFD